MTENWSKKVVYWGIRCWFTSGNRLSKKYTEDVQLGIKSREIWNILLIWIFLRVFRIYKSSLFLHFTLFLSANFTNKYFVLSFLLFIFFKCEWKMTAYAVYKPKTLCLSSRDFVWQLWILILYKKEYKIWITK